MLFATLVAVPALLLAPSGSAMLRMSSPVMQLRDTAAPTGTSTTPDLSGPRGPTSTANYQGRVVPTGRQQSIAQAARAKQAQESEILVQGGSLYATLPLPLAARSTPNSARTRACVLT
jgi:hypothetical protein